LPFEAFVEAIIFELLFTITQVNDDHNGVIACHKYVKRAISTQKEKEK